MISPGRPIRHFRHVRSTLLMIGEGGTETAFLEHLRSLYCERNIQFTVTIRNAHSKEQTHLLDFARRLTSNIDYDRCIILLGAGIPWTAQSKERARQGKFDLVDSEPCIEGLLLSILDDPVPDYPSACKTAIGKALPSVKLTEKGAYTFHFGKGLLEEVRDTIPMLNKLLEALEGR
jgi:hypothetical protein